MLEQFRFYAKHSFNDLRVNGQRTFFALLCIAAGVAAIVSLQTVAEMIDSTLTGNLQENNRGDIVLQIEGNFGDEGDIEEDAPDENAIYAQGVEEGILIEEEFTFFGQTSTSYFVSEQGLERLQTWVDENFPGAGVTFTYRQEIASDFELFFGTGNGTSISLPDSDVFVSQAAPIVINAGVYPFYSTVETQDGTPLGEALTGSTDIVLSQKFADELGVSVGDTVLLQGATNPFTVTGVVDDEVEVKGINDIFNSIFGYYYLDHSAITQFDSVDQIKSGTLFMRIENATPELVVEVDNALQEDFPFFETTTTEELREAYVDLTAAIDDLVTVMGLVSMLIGSIGIINTMQVIVRRRTVEVAVLKTIGLQANQVTTLFLVEALIMGIIGSIAGILLGWGATFFIRGAASSIVGGIPDFQFVPVAVVNGFVIGVLVTVVFGFLPTLSAGQVRPGIVLRPSDALVPRAGILRSLAALLLIVVALTIIAAPILGSMALAVQVVVGAFIGVGILYGVLNLLVWLVGRFLPAFGIVDLKISLRQMLASRRRAAVTLLALVIGVFSLSLITLLAQSIANVLEETLETGAGGNVAVLVQNVNSIPQIEEILAEQEGVNSYRVIQSYGVAFQSLEKANGEVFDLEALRPALNETSFGGFGGPPPEDEEGGFSRVEAFEGIMSSIDARRLDDTAVDANFDAGRALTPEDAGQPVVVVQNNPFVDAAGIEVGDTLNFVYVVNGEETERTIALEVVGLENVGLVQVGFDGALRAPAGFFPDDLAPSNSTVVIDVEQENVSELRREMLGVPGVFLLDTAIVTRIVEAFLGAFTAFPTMVALLGLVVGGVVIANSVALTTMERRKEIAVMKSVGLQRERVLGMILMENGIMGFIGGLLGVGIGVVSLTAMISLLAVPLSAIPLGTAALLMGLCILVALAAAITTAWNASGEKPLNVLRYD